MEGYIGNIWPIRTSIHRSMGSATVCAQCPFTSSLGEFQGYREWLWYHGLSPVLVSIALPFAFYIWMFSIHSSSPAIGFHSSIFLLRRNLHPTTNPAPYSRLRTGTMVIGYPKRLRYHGGVTNVHRIYNYALC